MGASVRETILDALKSFVPREREPLSTQTRFPWDFIYPSHKHVVYFTRTNPGKKGDFANLAVFWISTIFDFLETFQDNDQFKDLVQESLCKPLNIVHIREIVQQKIKDLAKPLRFEIDSSIVTAYHMVDRQDVQALVVEASDAYYAFFWKIYPEFAV